MLLARTVREAREFAAQAARPIGLVPTMGALHAGHLRLVERAAAENPTVVASIFVNPLQFGPTEDFSRYPRAFASDLAALEAAGVAMVFAPDVAEMYPAGFATAVDPGPLGEVFEGALRPGHFRGVATVCTKLFSICGAARAYFGQKDAQQVAVLRRIVADLNLPVELAVLPTVRDRDGLALSSRNVYLSPEERAAAPGLYHALREIADSVAIGNADRTILETARRHLAPPLREAYLDIVDPITFAPLAAPAAPALAIGSVYVGATRLIDNLPIGFAVERAA
jgi:pantoate--beta-alanine ligase